MNIHNLKRSLPDNRVVWSVKHTSEWFFPNDTNLSRAANFSALLERLDPLCYL